MATASSPAKLQFKGSRASSPRSNIELENLKLQAENLLSLDSRYILAFLANLYAPGEPFEGRREEANKLLDVAIECYADGLSAVLCMHLQQNFDETTRLRCAMLLQRLFHPQKNFYNCLSLCFQMELKSVLFQRIGNETNADAFKTVMYVVSNVAQVLLPNKQWPELYDFIFESLKSDVSRRKCCALVLLAELIPRCPGVFLFHIDVLTDAFKGFMDGTLEDCMVAAAAVKAAVALVLHLATPSNHEKYYDLLLNMGGTLVDAVNGVNDSETQEIIADMTVLAQTETRFLSPYIDYLVETMLDVAETPSVHVDDKTRESAVEFVVIVAEDVEYGCGMIQNISAELLKRLFTILLRVLSTIEEDPSWDQYDGGSDSEEDELNGSICSYAMEAIPRLVRAVRENVIIRNLPDCFPQFMKDLSWQRRHAAITALGLIAGGCPKACSGISMTFQKIIADLCCDKHPRVCWATIRAIGQFSKHSGQLFHSIVLPGLIFLMENFNRPKLQIAATSSIMLLSKNCDSEIFSPHLKRILSCLCAFLQKGIFKEEALTALASLADTFQMEFVEYYDAVLGYVKVFLAIRHEKRNSMVPAKALECMTTIAVAAGKNRFMTNVDKVIELLINFQEANLDSDDPMRYHILRAWGRLGKCLGTDFVPYLSVSVRQLLESAKLQNNLNSGENSNGESVRSNAVEEKATACEVLCTFATEFTAEIHLWINDILPRLVPLLTFKYNERVRIHAISTTPLMLQSASCAVNKLLPLRMPMEKISNDIVPALIDALRKERESGIQLKIVEALNKCIKIMGSCLDKSLLNQFIKVITEVLSTYSNKKTERKRRVEGGLDHRDKTVLQEEIEIENNIYRATADCLSSIVNIFKTSFLPIFDKLLPCLVLHWNTNSTEKRIFLRILRDIAKNCKDDAFKHYEEHLLSMLKSCNLNDPSVWQLVGYGISICAEFGGDVFKLHFQEVLYALQRILTHPHALDPRNVINREIAVFALGKMCKCQFKGPDAHLGVRIWLTYLPLRNNLAEAQQMHDDLCTMVEKSEEKVLGPHPQYSDYKTLIGIFARILCSGYVLATEDTSNRIKKILRKFKERMLSCDFESICSSFPLPVRTTLNSSISF